MASAAQENKCKLTKRIVESTAPDPLKRTFLWDTEIRGFCLRIYPSGKKTYFLQYRNGQNVTKKIKIGVHGSITTEYAREKASQLSLEIGAGQDPSEKIAAVKNAHTMSDLGREYLNHHAKLKKRPNGCKQDEKVLKDIILKNFGHLAVENVSTFDLQKLHSSLQKTPYQANRIRSLLSKMFNLAIQWKWRIDNPINAVEKYQEYKRHRWLDDDEVQRLLAVLKTYHNQSVANAIRLLLLTGSRRSEVLTATWDQFDLQKGLWIKPAHTTKQKRMEHLPLSTQVIEMLKNMKKQTNSSFLFPGRIEGKPLQEIKKGWETIKKMADIADFRLHDLRHTHASHLVSSGLSLSIVGKLLGHTQASTTQRYAHLADEPLREAAERFGNKVEKLAAKKS